MNKYIIGVDVGGTNVKLGLVNSRGKIIARSRLNTKRFNRTKIKLINAIVLAIEDLIKSKGLKKKNIRGVGVGLPGFINPQKGLVYFLPNIPGWRNVAFAKILRSKLKLPVFIENDAHLITLAEWKMGAGRGYKNLICLTLGTGVGGGLILDNKLYHGEDSVAGEVGHIPYLEKTLEKYVGNKTIGQKACKVFNKKGLEPKDLYVLANRGNKKAKKIWREVGAEIGFVLAGIVNILNPKLIIFGGGVSNNFHHFGPSVRKTIKSKAIPVSASSVKLVRAKLGDDAGILGAHVLVKESIIG